MGGVMDSCGQQVSEKAALETKKLLLETHLLQRQLSPQGVLISWLQATSVPVALLGAILAFFVGFGQLRQSADSQTADRFDKALTRLASQRPDERMTGVSGLNLFVSDKTQALKKQALVFLVNALSLENDERVRGAILDVLTALPTESSSTLDEGLRTAIERNRSLTHSIVHNWPKRVFQRKKQVLAKLKIAGLDLDAIDNEIPVQTLAVLSTEQYLSLLDEEHGPFDMLDQAEFGPLVALSKAIETLVAHGAANVDFRGIYCEDCKFSAGKSFDKAIFDESYLAGADFSRKSLRQASFRNADVAAANFFDADLSGATLRVEEFRLNLAGKGLGFVLPQLECAKLDGVDLSGQPLVLLIQSFKSSGASPKYQIILPRMISVHLDQSTKLDSFSIVTATEISDGYLETHKSAPEVEPLMNREFALWDSPVETGRVSAASIRRIHGTFAMDPKKYSATIALAQWQFGANDLKRLANDAFMLRWYIDQPALRSLPLYSQFVRSVDALTIPDRIEATVVKQLSDDAVGTWAKLKPSSCSGDQRRREFESNIDLSSTKGPSRNK
jgi:uncharacterized protein YjbI with pentapeptide repeats